jgi:acyl-[acyl carrier protein]--UDP-N-acetylglucosamine O-acyltransferase
MQGLMTTTTKTKIHKTALVSDKAELGIGVEIGP